MISSERHLKMAKNDSKHSKEHDLAIDILNVWQTTNRERSRTYLQDFWSRKTEEGSLSPCSQTSGQTTGPKTDAT